MQNKLERILREQQALWLFRIAMKRRNRPQI